MLRLDKIIKPWKESAALNDHINLYGFWNDTTFLTNQELATYDPRRFTGVSVYREIEREFSIGDRIQFTAPDKSRGVANRDLALIHSIALDGRVTARLDNTGRSNSTPPSIAISITATPSPVTAPKALPPNACSFTPIPAFIPICSILGSPTFPSHARAMRPRSSPTTWQNSCPNSEPMFRKPRLGNQPSFVHRSGNWDWTVNL
jgi:hypothetical protein